MLGLWVPLQSRESLSMDNPGLKEAAQPAQATFFPTDFVLKFPYINSYILGVNSILIMTDSLKTPVLGSCEETKEPLRKLTKA